MFVNNQEAIIKEIERHSSDSFPNECCGLVLKTKTSFTYLRAKNISKDPQHSFSIEPSVIALNYDAIAYVVHSHVNGLPTPSDKDIESCERLNKPFLIIGFPSDRIFTLFPKSYDSAKKGVDFFCGANDCYTLVRDFYKEQFDIDLIDHARLKYGWWDVADDYTKTATVNAALEDNFRVVDTPKHGDVIIAKLGTLVPTHWGIYLKGGDIYQCSPYSGYTQGVYDGQWRKNTVCFLRHYGRD